MVGTSRKELGSDSSQPSFRLNQSRRGGRPWFCPATRNRPRGTRTSGFEVQLQPRRWRASFSPWRTLWAPGQDMERNASSFVIRVTNGTGSVRQFASKAARCEARAAFELSDQPPRFGGAGLRSEMFLLGSPEAVTAAKATRNAVIRSWILAASGKEKKAPPGDHPSLARLSSLP